MLIASDHMVKAMATPDSACGSQRMAPLDFNTNMNEACCSLQIVTPHVRVVPLRKCKCKMQMQSFRCAATECVTYQPSHHGLPPLQYITTPTSILRAVLPHFDGIPSQQRNSLSGVRA
mmetsp:Transcript_16544/g.45830  ORF Transcript_16544/g.45830 Transcript_16544/m.45830 type:complete len:118 (-) Transcript_16544:1405-1758(-)